MAIVDLADLDKRIKAWEDREQTRLAARYKAGGLPTPGMLEADQRIIMETRHVLQRALREVRDKLTNLLSITREADSPREDTRHTFAFNSLQTCNGETLHLPVKLHGLAWVRCPRCGFYLRLRTLEVLECSEVVQRVAS